MRTLILAAALALIPIAPQPAPARVPVVVELFTSEGCSSCPPADQLLSRLVKEQPVAGVQVIPLGMHVTYWDELGWKDPASLPDATARQQAYSRVFGADRVYTPQAVVDGREELVGSDEDGVRRALERAAKQPHARVAVTAAFDGADTIVARVSASDLPSDAKDHIYIRLYITENGLTSVVRRGENGGRTLNHDAVVRREVPFATTTWPQLPTSIEISGIRREWRHDHLQIVAVVQAEKTRRIWGAATTAVK